MCETCLHIIHARHVYDTVAVTGSRYEVHADEDGCCEALVYDIILRQDSTMP